MSVLSFLMFDIVDNFLDFLVDVVQLRHVRLQRTRRVYDGAEGLIETHRFVTVRGDFMLEGILFLCMEVEVILGDAVAARLGLLGTVELGRYRAHVRAGCPISIR